MNMENNTEQFDFLKMYIEKTLDDAGFDAMSEETRAQYVPQFMAEAEKRIGIAVMPLLKEDALPELETLLSGTMSPEDMRNFWQSHVPNFDEIVQQTLTDFSKELQQIVASLH